MKIKTVKIQNFRGYKDETVIDFDDLTVIVGKNDIGKSTIFEALDIFFENRKIDANDRCIYASAKEYPTITVIFKDLPSKLVLDSTVETSLQDEFLVNATNDLEIKKTYASKVKTQIACQHFKEKNLKDLLLLKIEDLKQRAIDLTVDKTKYNAKISSDIRKAIREHPGIKLDTIETLLDVDQEGLKNIWDKILQYLPLYALFQADRKNDEKDTEVQNPLKFAAEQALKKYQGVLNRIKERVEKQVSEIADLTIDKLKEMNEDVAEKLKPQFDKELKWADLFKPTLSSDDVPMNKRGSGVRRLILINFFRAEAERKKTKNNNPNVIYAIEEPETSQHPDWQKKLIEALVSLSKNDNTQVLVSTHSPALSRLVPINSIRYIQKDKSKKVTIDVGSEKNLEDIANTLGVLPDIPKAIEKLKVILCLEGPNDIIFFQNLLKLFGLDIENNEKVISIFLGGATLEQWVKNNYLKKLNLPEIHIYDSDVAKYAASIAAVNGRGGKNYGTQTIMYEIENYIHPDLIGGLYKVTDIFFDTSTPNWIDTWKIKDVPKELSVFLKALKAAGQTHIRGESPEAIKPTLAYKGSPLLTKKHIEDLKADKEVESWVSKIQDCFL
ncbi:ATP-binding protein [Parasegetibacter sp. NRK P23]|uniref:ATP-binding protein n=1 Tax=Parasegetibacter sp. NRK P23 TaxID=2942999 RepID=UPI002044C446|nr:ATP-binding protein [Parasegetibacter sp. NRK P23]MCM5530326.1 ATP-binding protein [Parasegetibacter sp. NRK P23]